MIALPLLLLFACGAPDDEAAAPPDSDHAGPWSVGQRTLSVQSAGRTLPVEVWYPSEEPPIPAPLWEMVDEADRDAIAALFAEAPEGCPTRETDSARDAAPAAGSWPLVVFSHCHTCTRFSAQTLAERLASHGFVVAAPDHVGNTLADEVHGDALPVASETLTLRVGDMRATLDAVLAPGAVPDLTLDATRVGAFGHSFGAVTTGALITADDRITAGFALAAPMENPLLPGVDVGTLGVPLGFLVAVEDNSITELGNVLLRDNAEESGGWIAEIEDAGHWSFSDLCGLAPFGAGCGEGVRQTDGTPFTYLDPEEGRGLARLAVTAFFRARLLGEAASEGELEALAAAHPGR